MMSSVMPSLKYSCSGSPLMLAKGSTQIATREFGAGCDGADLAAGFTDFRCAR